MVSPVQRILAYLLAVLGTGFACSKDPAEAPPARSDQTHAGGAGILPDESEEPGNGEETLSGQAGDAGPGETRSEGSDDRRAMEPPTAEPPSSLPGGRRTTAGILSVPNPEAFSFCADVLERPAVLLSADGHRDQFLVVDEFSARVEGDRLLFNFATQSFPPGEVRATLLEFDCEIEVDDDGAAGGRISLEFPDLFEVRFRPKGDFARVRRLYWSKPGSRSQETVQVSSDKDGPVFIFCTAEPQVELWVAHVRETYDLEPGVNELDMEEN